jgi:hypothetical protein
MGLGTGVINFPNPVKEKTVPTGPCRLKLFTPIADL